MAALGNIGTAIRGDEPPLFSYTVAPAVWPDISLAMPQDQGSGSTNPETFSAYVSG